MRYQFLTIFVLSIAITSCKSSDRLKRIDLSLQIGKLASVARADSSKFLEFPLCELVRDSNWDKLHVVSPYMSKLSIDSLGIENIGDFDDILDSVLYRENGSLLIFSKKGQGIFYTFLSYNHVNFNFIVRTREISGVAAQIFDRAICSQLLLKSTGKEVIVADRAYVLKNVSSPAIVSSE